MLLGRLGGYRQSKTRSRYAFLFDSRLNNVQTDYDFSGS